MIINSICHTKIAVFLICFTFGWKVSSKLNANLLILHKKKVFVVCIFCLFVCWLLNLFIFWVIYAQQEVHKVNKCVSLSKNKCKCDKKNRIVIHQRTHDLSRSQIKQSSVPTTLIRDIKKRKTTKLSSLKNHNSNNNNNNRFNNGYSQKWRKTCLQISFNRR